MSRRYSAGPDHFVQRSGDETRVIIQSARRALPDTSSRRNSRRFSTDSYVPPISSNRHDYGLPLTEEPTSIPSPRTGEFDDEFHSRERLERRLEELDIQAEIRQLERRLALGEEEEQERARLEDIRARDR